MPTQLRQQLEAATARYSEEVVAIIRAASLADILAETRGTPASATPAPKTASRRTAPRSATSKAPATTTPEASTASAPAPAKGDRLALLVGYLRSHPGASAPELRKALGMSVESWRHHFKKGEAAGVIRKEGRRLAGRYWAEG